jgi:hypothetical protein
VVDGINDTFGLILLISVTHFFVDLISHLFYTWNNISSLTRLGATIYLVNVLRKFVFFWFIVWTPTEIHRKVSCSAVIFTGRNVNSEVFWLQAFKVVILLRKINCVQFHLQKQVRTIFYFAWVLLDVFKSVNFIYKVHFLALYTFKNLPQISSLGYFDVNFRLLPKVKVDIRWAIFILVCKYFRLYYIDLVYSFRISW